MISDEKMSHIVHLLMNGLEKEGFVSFPNKEIAVREAHKISNLYLGNLKNRKTVKKTTPVFNKTPSPVKPERENPFARKGPEIKNPFAPNNGGTKKYKKNKKQ